MTYIGLSKGKFTTVDDEDAEFLSLWKWSYSNPNKGKKEYAIRGHHFKGENRSTTYTMHRILLERILGRPLGEGEVPDHKDGNGLNNTRENLRLATTQKNNQNLRSLQANATSRYKGVSWDSRRQKWRAVIRALGKKMELGRFDGEVMAAKAHDIAAIKYHGEFAVTNAMLFPGEIPEELVLDKPRTQMNGHNTEASSRYRGVSWIKSRNKWQAGVKHKGKMYHAGRFTDELDAARAYDEKALEVFGPDAVLNRNIFPEDFM